MPIDFIKKGLVLCFCLGLVACSDSDDDNDTGNGVYAYIEVTAEGDGTTDVTALMLNGRLGAGTEVDIPYQELLANAIYPTSTPDTEFMARVINLVFQDRYEIENLFVGDALDTVFEVVYTTAPSSTVNLPMGFDIDPAVAVSWSDSNLNVSLGNDDAGYAGGATLTLNYEVLSCDALGNFLPVISIDFSLLDNETVIPLPMAAIEASVLDGDPTGASCEVEIELVRSIAGTLDSNYADGSITGIQTRTETYTITP